VQAQPQGPETAATTDTNNTAKKRRKMKTLLSIGILVAVIAWTGGLTCWRGGPGLIPSVPTKCGFPPPETTLDKTVCVKGECPKDDKKPKAKVACWKKILSYGMEVKETVLGCGTYDSEADLKCSGEPEMDGRVLDEPGGTKTECLCNTALCNDDPTLKPKPKPLTSPAPENGPQNAADRTSYTHLIIAFIVGAMFLH